MPKGQKSGIKRPAFAKPTRWQAGQPSSRRADTTFMTRSITFGGSRRFWLSISHIATRYLPNSLVAIELRPGYFCGFYRD